ncbi:PAS domain S-box protein [bacterium]|nr:PAS domain S-box protein [bacterium]
MNSDGFDRELLDRAGQWLERHKEALADRIASAGESADSASNIPIEMRRDWIRTLAAKLAEDCRTEKAGDFGQGFNKALQALWPVQSGDMAHFPALLGLLSGFMLQVGRIPLDEIGSKGAPVTISLLPVLELLNRASSVTRERWLGWVLERQQKDRQLIEELSIVKNDLQSQLNAIYQIVKEFPIGVADCDEALNVLHWNPMAVVLTGFQPSDILKKKFQEILHGPSQKLFLEKLSTESRGRIHMHLRIRLKEGGTFAALVSVRVFRKAYLGKICFVILFQEVGEKSKFSSQVKRIDKLTTISRLTSAMMHDIRNPLNTIGLNTELLESMLMKDHGSIKPEAQDLIDKIQRQVHQLSQSLNHYLAYTHLTELHMQPENISIHLTDMLEDVRYEASVKKVQVRFQKPRTPFWILADWLQLKRVFTNLIQNAFEVLGPSGCIAISIRRRRKRLLVQIRDNGPGIDPNHLKKIFEPFFTTKPAGEGLGLFISREIVEAHRGRMTVRSDPDQGTCFTISLPLWNPGENP